MDVAATSSRLTKVARIAALLHRAAPDTQLVTIIVSWLSGELPQRHIGVGWAALRSLPPPAPQPALTVTGVDATLSKIGTLSGKGSQAQRAALVAELFSAATEAEQTFLLRLLGGELRQGAKGGIMADAVAQAAGLANAAAAAFYAQALQSDEAAPARQYLTERSFDAAAARKFGCGFAPSGWDSLTKHLQRKGFEFEELEAAGLSRQGRHGPMDRFHRRLLWPIRTSAGEVVGFGARRLFDDDAMEAKYVNTPETLLYKKSSVMFGIDLAKRDIAKGHQAVVVEGYTDVMAMHLAGVTTAVASCGTAFGGEHLAMLRRLMMDDSFFRGELIYVFDGDEAGRAAALKAFDGEQKLAGQSFVAVAPDGMDPCDLRLKCGDAALRDLVARRTPLFEFAIRAAIAEMDLDSAEGRVAALRRCVPMVGQIKDPTLRDEYARQLAGWVGWADVAQVIGRVRGEAKRTKHPRLGRLGSTTIARAAQRPTAGPPTELAVRPDPRDPTLWPQREALKSALQYPALAGPVFDALTVEGFTHPEYAAVRAAIDTAGGTSAGLSGAQWLDMVRQQTTSTVTSALISELGVEAIQVDDDKLPRYIAGVLARLQEVWLGRQIAEVKSKLQRMSPIEQGDEYHALFGDLVAMEAYRRSLLEQASGDDLTA